MLKQTFLSSMIFLSTASAVFAKPLTYGGASLGLNASYSSDHKISNIGGELFYGKGFTFGRQQNFYFGSEVRAGANHYQGETNFNFGAYLMPGYLVNENTMIYGTIGGYAQTNPPKKDRWAGVESALGIQTKINEKWDLRLEQLVASSNYNTKPRTNVGFVYHFD